MAERRARIASKVGLHARPAAVFVRAVSEQGVPVQIAKPAADEAGRGPVDASSVLGLMTLGAKYGDEVVLTADGDGADQALERLADLLSQELDNA